MKRWIQFTAVLFAVALLFGLVACGGNGEENTYVITEKYRVVYATNDLAARSAARQIATAFRDKTGKTLKVSADSSEKEGKEILIGAVQNRKFSYCAPRLAKRGGWFVGVLEDDIYLVSDTGDYSDVAAAFNTYFIKQSFTQDTSISSAGNYALGTIRLNGLPLPVYSITYKWDSARAQEAAELTREWLSEKAGYELPVTALSESDGEYIICFGALDETGTLPSSLADDEFAVNFGEKFVGIAPEDSLTREEYYIDSANSFLTRYFVTGEENVTVCENGTKYLKSWEYLNTRLEKRDDGVAQTVAEGVTVQKILLTGNASNIISAYVMEAKARNDWELRVATHPDYTREKPVVSTVLNTAEAVKKGGPDVLFACNAGFFFMNDNNHPEGALIVDGEILSYYGGDHLGGNHQVFFGITYDGKYVIGNRNELKDIYTQLRYATGGRGILLKDGEPYDICYDSSDALGENVHPRTCVGVRENGDIIVIVADGRQTGYSDGMNLYDMALLLQAYGAVDAINLDGGGSSTFVVKGKDGVLRVLNKPSNENNSLRAVGDCLVLVSK